MSMEHKIVEGGSTPQVESVVASGERLGDGETPPIPIPNLPESGAACDMRRSPEPGTLPDCENTADQHTAVQPKIEIWNLLGKFKNKIADNTDEIPVSNLLSQLAHHVSNIGDSLVSLEVSIARLEKMLSPQTRRGFVAQKSCLSGTTFQRTPDTAHSVQPETGLDADTSSLLTNLQKALRGFDLLRVDDAEDQGTHVSPLERLMLGRNATETVPRTCMETFESDVQSFALLPSGVKIRGIANVGSFTVQEQRTKTLDVVDHDTVSLGIFSQTTTHDDCKCDITASQFFPSGQLLLCDHGNGKVKLFDQDIQFQSAVSLHSRPWDLAIVGKAEAIVTLPEAQKMQYVELVENKLKVGWKMDIGYTCKGVAYQNEKLFVTSFVEVLILSMRGRILKRYYTWSLPDPDYIAVDCSERMFITKTRKNTLMCIDSHGKTLYTRDDIKEPRALLVDAESYVIVCEAATNSVRVLTPGGKSYKTLLQAAGVSATPSPATLTYRPSDRTIVVGMLGRDDLFVYKSQ